MLSKKEAKEFGYRCKRYAKQNQDFIRSLSPLKGFLRGEWDWIDCDKEFFSKSERYEETVNKYKSRGFYDKDFIDALSRIINADAEIQGGNIEYIQERCDSIGTLGKLIGCINNARKVDLIHSLITDSRLSENTLFMIKMTAYGTIEEDDEEARRLTRMCIGDNSIDTIYSSSVEMDILLESSINKVGGGNMTEIMKFELDIIREKIERGETVTLYRGFAINQDERVRKGYKRDGAEYFKQCAGTGISYSLNRNVAGYFAMRSIMMENGRFIDGNNFWSSTYVASTQVPVFCNLVSKDGYVNARAKDISDMREERGLKPIICEYVLEPDKFKGYLLTLGEGEVMALPEDMQVKRYTIATSKEIAECQYEWMNKGNNLLTSIHGGLVKDGIVCWVSGEGHGKIYATFAPANEIKEVASEFINAYFSGKSQNEILKASFKLNMAMNKYALELPKHMEPTSQILTRELYQYLRKPVELVRAAGKKYRIGTKKK